jgi:hypothetical protein
LKVYLRDPNSYTPLIKPGGLDGKARSLTLGRNSAENVKQIAQFSIKDSQVNKFIVNIYRKRKCIVYIYIYDLRW